MASKDGALLWNQERSILDTTELICDVMQKSGVTRADLADLLGKTRGYVSQLLDGTANMTVRTISDVFTVMGYEFVPRCRRMEHPEDSLHFSFNFEVPEEGPIQDESWQVNLPQLKTL